MNARASNGNGFRTGIEIDKQLECAPEQCLEDAPARSIQTEFEQRATGVIRSEFK
jgi:hypothetical protein